MNTTGCSPICQHPGCWKSQIDQLRKRRDAERSSDSIKSGNLYHLFDARDLRICENVETLPSYNILNLFKNELENISAHLFPQSTEVLSKQDGPQWSSFQNYQTNQISMDSMTYPNSARTKWQYNKSTSSKQEELKFKTIELDGLASTDELERIYTWVPGKKSRRRLQLREKNVNEDGVNVKLLDGELLPENFIHKAKTKERKHLCSPTGGRPYTMRPYTMRTTSNRLPPLITDEIFKEIDIFQLFGPSINEYLTADSRLSDFTHIPSPLRTKRMSIQPHLLSRVKSSKVTGKQEQSNVKCDGGVVKETPPSQVESEATKQPPVKEQTVSDRHHDHKDKPRSLLRLTRVSVPKKCLQRYPVFHHCSSSIKNDKLSEVEMKPLSSSENVSTASSNASMEYKIPLSSRRTKDIARRYHEVSIPKNTPEFSIQRTSPISCSLDKPDKEKVNALSPLAMEITNEPSEDYSSDQDLIRQTYERYQSMSAFKTKLDQELSPCEGQVNDTSQTRFNRISGKQYVPTSIHVLDCYAPDELLIKKKISFVKRNISPNKSSQMRHQRQPPLETLPTEMKVSQMQMFPLRAGDKALPSALPLDIISETPPSSPVEKLAKHSPVYECSTDDELTMSSQIIVDIAQESPVNTSKKSSSAEELNVETSSEAIRLSKTLSEMIVNNVYMESIQSVPPPEKS